MRQNWLDKSRADAAAAWRDLRYGMFIHYGLYSMLGGVWNGRPVRKGYSEQILSHGDVPQADYEALSCSFTAERFDAAAIASLARDAGMRYVVMVAKHHDGFCLFDTRTTGYRSTASPCGRDLVGEMAAACRDAGLGFGVYFSWIDWNFPLAAPISPHNSDPIGPEHMRLNLAQLEELLTNYGPIRELWMDMGAPTAAQSQAVRDLALRLQPGVMVNGRIWNDRGDFDTMADNETPSLPLATPWQTPASIYHATWGYRSWQKRDDLEGRIDAISGGLSAVLDQGGNYLLNIGPMGDGSVVPFERDVLLGVARRIEARGGLARRPRPAGERTLMISGAPARLERRDGLTLFRHTGAEYYSMKAIPTAVRWTVDVQEEGSWALGCALDGPLETEEKLCVETEEDSFVFSLKRGSVDSLFCSGAHLRRGRQEIVLTRPGEEMSKAPLPEQDIALTMRKA